MATNVSQYDSIAEKYVEGHQTNFLESVECYTVYHCLLKPLLDEHGLLTGKRVLDLGCGQGHHTRRLKALNCDYILGVDISSEMIKLALEAENENPKGLNYIVADVKKLPLPEKPYDLVTAFYLLNFARTREDLLEMARTIYAQLGENKRFIGVTANVVGGKDSFDKRKYGVVRHVNIPLDEGLIPDGTEVFVTLYNKKNEPTCTFTTYYLSPNTHEQVFKEVGFKTFEWVHYQCDPDVPNKAFYDDLIKCANGIGVIATK
ncbi:unnamed protein product [Rotaria sp. Silwood2]|nr:unnamed protein product [Rotaria sp. Silwood2]CAF2941377.1 unnamed protein product [Rotaria sp. Silwood2]CAF3268704.1 unnamed protein product [Rotaria sp. Silwood2]CAF3399357.1 unnamed protein product [Rotaria sp. Silwood2]CAF3943469.1 unnamed protein product [Rotaria sp. Silwood2]